MESNAERILRLKQEKSEPILSVHFDDMVDSEDDGYVVRPLCGDVIRFLKRKMFVIVVWIDGRHGKSKKGLPSYEDTIGFLVENGVPVDHVCSFDLDRALDSDILLSGETDFDGDWRRLAIELGVIKDGVWQVFLVKCQDGSLVTGKCEGIEACETRLKNGLGSRIIREKGFDDLAWVSRDMSQKRARKMLAFLRDLGRKDRSRLARGKVSIERESDGTLYLL